MFGCSREIEFESLADPETALVGCESIFMLISLTGQNLSSKSNYEMAH
jgi:hypothetical protein